MYFRCFSQNFNTTPSYNKVKAISAKLIQLLWKNKMEETGKIGKKLEET